jgi:putative transposase
LARKNRIFLPNLPLHIIKKGINSEKIFHDLEDYEKFFTIMIDYAKKYKIKIYTYVLVEDFFEFVISAYESENISKYMQSISRNYVLHFNKKYNRTGTIWEGRYKTSLVENTKYLTKVISYIEKIALKHSLENTICSTLKEKKDIQLEKKDEEFILKCLNSENITGDDSFVENIENIVGQSLAIKKRGRPKNDEIRGEKMYKKLELLSKDKHYDLKISQLGNLNFAKGQVSIPVLISEMAKIASNFPIVFTADENPTIIALSSLGKENLAITEDGKWITNYIPAVYRKYPFTYVNVKENSEQKAVAIDIEAQNISTEVGSELFDENKEQTQLLKDTIQFLTSYEQEAMKTQSIAKMIADTNILEDREISVGEGKDKQVLVKGFKVVNKEKLNKLDDATLALWVRNGFINFIELHLKSLENMQTLMNLSAQRNS